MSSISLPPQSVTLGASLRESKDENKSDERTKNKHYKLLSEVRTQEICHNQVQGGTNEL